MGCVVVREEVVDQLEAVLPVDLGDEGQVIKAFAAEAYEQQKYDRKAQELRQHYFQTERLQETNGAWMSLYFTGTLGMVLWFGGWEVMHSHLTAGGLTQFVLYMNQLAFPIRQLARVIDSLSRAISMVG